MNLILIGYRGTGKSTVARQLSLRLEWPWLDADVELELRAGKSIKAIFADGGESAFRDLETNVLDDLCGRQPLVLACGGGAVLRPENRLRIRESGKVVWLQASADTIWQRMAADETTTERRPNLTTAGGRQEIIRLLAEREPLYEMCADWVVDTNRKTPTEVAEDIFRWWRKATPWK